METTTLETNNNNLKFGIFDDDDKYEDDFETYIGKDDNSKLLSNKSAEPDDDQDVIVSTFKRITSPTKISQPRPRNEQTFDKPSDTDSEPEIDVYNFTEDQQRAMMELIAQKLEDVDLLDEEPPEYNVKGRIEQLNAELANDPMPVEKDREPRVGFKSEIVDLVAPPPPDYSDDESQANSSKGEMYKSTLTDVQKESKGNSGEEEKGSNKENVVDVSKKQFVVERDGQFSLLSAKELSSSERALFVNDDAKEKKVEKQSDNEKIKDKTQSTRSSSAGSSVPSIIVSSQVFPRPPSLPRPHTAVSGPRRNLHLTQSLQTKSVQSSNLSLVLDNFNYNSPYAMTPEQKEEAKDKARKLEEERKENERKNKEETELRRRENDTAFQAWLWRKMEEDRKRLGIDGETQKSEQERREENEDVYKSWLQEKKAQVKKDKLLKRRQQQEKVEGLVLHSPEECNEAFIDWLKKKNATSKKQIFQARQTNRMYQMQVQRSRKVHALIKALKDSETCCYVDYYGYRF